jgi:hypothetical protein
LQALAALNLKTLARFAPAGRLRVPAIGLWLPKVLYG